MAKIIERCRVCKNNELIEIFSLGNQRLTGVFPTTIEEFVGGGEVNLIKCNPKTGCGLVQLRQSYDLSEMYGDNYGYRSGLNPSMVLHLKGKVDHIISMGILEPGDIIVDIGSNDATTLKCYPNADYKLIGVDPSGLKFSDFYSKNICLIPDFFSEKVLKSITLGRPAKVITSFSMFYDLEDPVQFAKEVCNSLDKNGIWMFEQSYLPSMLKTCSFDTICHEHLEFYAMKQINWILDVAGLKPIDVQFNEINGGSFSIVASRKDSEFKQNTKVLAAIDESENNLNLDGLDIYSEFVSAISIVKSELMDFLQKAKRDGKRVCGLGASTKGNVLLQYFNIGPDLVESIGEVNPDKFGCFTPGTLIPLVDENKLLESKPDYLLVLPWHFKQFFKDSAKFKGCKLVFPLPNFEIL